MPRDRSYIIDMEMTGLNIRNLTRKKGLDSLIISEKLYISRQGVYRWFIGTSIPSIDSLLGLSILLDVPIDLLIVTKSDKIAINETESHFIGVEELPSDDYNRMVKLVNEYSIPFHDLLSLYEKGFEFCCSADEFDSSIE